MKASRNYGGVDNVNQFPIYNENLDNDMYNEIHGSAEIELSSPKGGRILGYNTFDTGVSRSN